MSDGQKKWIRVTPDEARKHPLYGVNGWLIILGLILAYTVVMNVLSSREPMPDTTGMADEFVALIRFEYAAGMALAVWGVVTIGLLLGKVRAFRASVLGILIVTLVYNYGDMTVAYFMAKQYYPAITLGELLDKDTIRLLVRSVTSALIWGSYVVVSRRVNVTYLHRVRADDLKLVRPEAWIAPPEAPASPIVG